MERELCTGVVVSSQCKLVKTRIPAVAPGHATPAGDPTSHPELLRSERCHPAPWSLTASDAVSVATASGNRVTLVDTLLRGALVISSGKFMQGLRAWGDSQLCSGEFVSSTVVEGSKAPFDSLTES